MIRRFLALCFPTIALLSGCQNNGEIGDLYGQWQLTQINTPDTLASPQHLFLAFQSQVFFARITGTDAHYSGTLKGSWRQSGDSLFLSFYSSEGQLASDAWYVQHHFGFGGDPADLRFGLQLSPRSMILTQEEASHWTFRKY